MAADAREFDVIVFGATGVTGRRVAKYLARRAPELGASWAAAGRDTGRLATTLHDQGVGELPELIAADVADRGSIDAMTARTRVLLNLVGPYTTFAPEVIESCIDAGTHYFDLSGEIDFVARITNRHHAAAEAAGVKVVQVAGFESLPPDMGIALGRDAMGVPPISADLVVRMQTPAGLPRPSDLISGGTFQSLRTVVGGDEADKITDPALLVPDPGYAVAVRDRSPIRLAPWRASDGSVVGPMAPAPFINPAVIHRSHFFAVSGSGDAPPLRYREGVAVGPRSGIGAAAAGVAAGGLSATQIATKAVASSPSGVRKAVAGALARIGPSSGFGPAEERINDFSWTMDLELAAADGSRAQVAIEADGHPGYLTTAYMMGEAGLIAADPDSGAPQRGGCITPSMALGTATAERFAHAGLRFRVSV